MRNDLKIFDVNKFVKRSVKRKMLSECSDIKSEHEFIFLSEVKQILVKYFTVLIFSLVLSFCIKTKERTLYLLVMLLISVLFYSCNLPTPADDPNIVSNLRFTPSAFDSFKKNTEIQYTLKNPVTVNISIIKKDSSGQEFLVKSLAEDIHETKGSHRHAWLGDNEKGLFVPIGTYIGIVQIETHSFEATVLVFHF